MGLGYSFLYASTRAKWVFAGKAHPFSCLCIFYWANICSSFS
jgi:hypothetical protein